MTNAMGGANLHTPQSIFQHMMGPPNVPQQGSPWMQMPQVPQLSIPWSVPALQQPELIRFTGEPSYGAIQHQKRKLEALDLIETRQAKQFITEEKMAAHFKDLRISSNYQPQSPVASTSKAGTDTVSLKSVMDLDLEAKASADGEQHPRLVLSEEIKSIPQEPIIPLSLLSKLERPTMALVLWEPPSKHLRLLPTPRETPTPIPSVSDDNNNSNDANNSSNNNNNSDINTNNNNTSYINNNNTSYINNNNNIVVNNNNNTINNNNEAMPDLNQALVNNSVRTVFEPMEL